MNNPLYATSGLGVRLHKRTRGRFEVRATRTQLFETLEEAYNWFRELEEEATLWDMTEFPELLESKHFT
jgi:hypothetical protein